MGCLLGRHRLKTASDAEEVDEDEDTGNVPVTLYEGAGMRCDVVCFSTRQAHSIIGLVGGWSLT